MMEQQTLYNEILGNIEGIFNGLMQHSDKALYEKCDQMIKTYESQHFPLWITALANLFSDESKEGSQARVLAGNTLKNLIYTNDEERINEFHQRWLSLDESLRNQIKGFIFNTLAAPYPNVRDMAAQCVSYVAVIELPINQWPELIQSLLDIMKNAKESPIPLQVATLTCLGHICEGVRPEALESSINNILSAIVQGLRDVKNHEVRFAASKALNEAIPYCGVVFGKEKDRGFLMNVIKDTCRSESEDIRKYSYRTIVQIATSYYEYLESDIKDFFELTLQTISQDVEDVALQAIEFWSSICDKEIDIAERTENALRHGTQIAIQSKGFIAGAASHLVPPLCQAIFRSDSTDILEGNNFITASTTCLNLIAATIRDPIVGLIMPFVEENIKSPDEKKKIAAILVFGSVLDGPSSEVVVPTTESALTFFFGLMLDNSENVRSITSWTLSRIAKYHVDALLQRNNEFLDVLSKSLDDVPKVAANTSMALCNYTENCHIESERRGFENPLLPIANAILQKLIETTQRPDAGENFLRNTAYEAINNVIEGCFVGKGEELIEIAKYFIGETKKSFSYPYDVKEDIQISLCGTLQVITYVLGDHVNMLLQELMPIYFELLKDQESITFVDALTCIQRAVLAAKEGFQQYVEPTMGHIVNILDKPQDVDAFRVAVFLVSDITRAVIQGNVNIYLDKITNQLLMSIQYPSMSLPDKANVLTALGCLAEATGENFKPYLTHVMEALIASANMSLQRQLSNEKDDNVYDGIIALREAVLECFISLTLLPKGSGITLEQAAGIKQLIVNFLTDTRTDDITYLATQLLGEIIILYGSELGVNWVEEFGAFLNGIEKDENFADVAKWVKSIIFPQN